MIKIDTATSGKTNEEQSKHCEAMQADDELLADDERTETEQSPVAKSQSKENQMTSSNNESLDCGKGDCVDSNENKGKSKRNRRKHKGGKHHPKKWKPYTKLSWDERKAVDERESIRANQRREERFSLGQPMAPYNTTQFLMDQHEASELDNQFKVPENEHPGLQKMVSRVSGEGSASMESSDEYYSSPDDEEDFLQKEFSEEYDTFHAERLQSMSKDDLVKEYIELESKVERLEKRHLFLKSTSKDFQELGENMDTLVAECKVEDLLKLTAENERLRRENEVLRTGLLNNVNSDNKENTPVSPHSE